MLGDKLTEPRSTERGRLSGPLALGLLRPSGEKWGAPACMRGGDGQRNKRCIQDTVGQGIQILLTSLWGPMGEVWTPQPPLLQGWPQVTSTHSGM